MVVTRIDTNARKILEQTKEKMKADGIAKPNLSEAIRYMQKRIEELESRAEMLEATGARRD